MRGEHLQPQVEAPCRLLLVSIRAQGQRETGDQVLHAQALVVLKLNPFEAVARNRHNLRGESCPPPRFLLAVLALPQQTWVNRLRFQPRIDIFCPTSLQNDAGYSDDV